MQRDGNPSPTKRIDTEFRAKFQIRRFAELTRHILQNGLNLGIFPEAKMIQYFQNSLAETIQICP